MNNKELNDQQIEQLVRETAPKVIKRRDDAIIGALRNMSREEFEEMIGRKKKATAPAEQTAAPAAPAAAPAAQTAAPEQKKSTFRLMTFTRLAAACAIVALIIVGIERLNLGGTAQNGYATLFNTYYKEYTVSGETFSAGKNKLNAAGQANTASIIQDASRLINKKRSRQALHEGITSLEDLLKKPYRRDLEHEIHWYLGLGYLKDNRVSKAREEFRKVIELKSSHTADARKLLEEIK